MGSKKNDRQTKLVSAINKAIEEDGFYPTLIPGVRLVKFSAPRPRQKAQWRASLAIIAQGHKEISLEENVYKYEQAHFIATPIDLPVVSRIPLATKDKPFLAVLITIDPVVLYEIASRMKSDEAEMSDMKSFGLFTGQAEDRLLESVTRLVRLAQRADEAAILGPNLIREILFRLLQSPDASALRQAAWRGTKLHQIVNSIAQIKGQLTEKLDIENLARDANMSRTSFFTAFKSVTALSPIQYQKRLRLLEARQMITTEGESASSAAFRVGYKSASQFSREYARMFGHPPGRLLKGNK